MESIKQFVCHVCGASFTKNKNRLRHVRTVHQGMKRTDKTRKSDSHEETAVVNISTDETGEPGLEIQTCQEPGADTRTFGEQVRSVPQVEFKPPSEYIAVARKAHEDRQLTSDEFMQATGLTVFKLITDTFWTALYRRPDLYVYVTEEMVSWLGERKGRPWDSMLSSCYIVN